MKSLKVLAAAVMLTVSGSSLAADYNWTFQSSDQPGDFAFQYQQKWTDRVKELTGGKIEITLVGSGAVVEANQTLDSISLNIIQGDMTDPSYFTGKNPAFALFGNLIGAWGTPSDQVDFFYNGGGFDVANQLLNKYDVELLAVSTVGSESFVSKVPLRNIADVKGVKLRAPSGMVADLFSKLGAAPVNLPGSEVYTSLEKGVIEAADYSIFARNQMQGLNDIAKSPIYPGWHSTPANQVTLNKSIYDSLPQNLKDALKQAGKEYSTGFLAAHQELDSQYVKKAKEKGVELISWEASELKIVRGYATNLWADWAAKSPEAKSYYDTAVSYLKSRDML